MNKQPRSTILFLFLSLGFITYANAQDSLGYYWKRCIGGYGNEVMKLGYWENYLEQNYYNSSNIIPPTVLYRPAMCMTNDGGIVSANTTFSSDGDIRGLRQYADTATNGAEVFVSRMSADGRMMWKRCIGGSGNDYATAIYADTDGFLIAGSTTSADGDFNNATPYALPFVVKLDMNGNIVWKKVYEQASGTYMQDNRSEAICKLPSGGFALLINQLQNDNYAKHNTLLFTLSNTGSFLDSTSFIGNYSNIAAGMIAEPDGSLLIAGTTFSTFGFITTPNAPWSSGYLAMLRKAGNKFTIGWITYPWVRNNASYTRIFDLVQGADGNVYMGATNFASSGADASAYVLKYDTLGNLKWGKNYPAHRIAYALDAADNNGIVMTPFSIANSTQSFNLVPVVRIDAQGNVLWEKYFQGNLHSFGMRVKYQSETAQYLMAVTNATQLPNHTYNQSYYDAIQGQTVYPTDLWMFKGTVGNVITGMVYYDINKNGIKNVNEPIVGNVLISTGKDSIRTKSVYSFGNSYFLTVDTGTYKTKVLLDASRPFKSVPATDTYTFTSRGQVRTANFAIQATTAVSDADVRLTAQTRPRVNTMLAYNVRLRNVGSVDLSNAAVTLVKDSRLTFVSAYPAPTQIVGDTLKWAYGALAVFTDSALLIYCKSAIPPVLNVGDTLRLSAKVTHQTSDATPLNNFDTIRQIVVGPVDPNDKSEIHNGQMKYATYQTGEYLQYLINFQNMGTDTAFYVEVRDTLDSRLDATTLQFLGSTYPCSVTLNDNVVLFKFERIALTTIGQNVDSSKGFISFRIKPKANLNIGDAINNKAAIYFDYNLPIVTNTATTTITANALPLQLISFQARRQGSINMLQWKTAHELNVARFVVERSGDGRLFTQIGTEQAGKDVYSYSDEAPLRNNNYYRLRMVDNDGKFSYSPVRLVANVGSISSVSLYPNPVRGQLQLQLDADTESRVQLKIMTLDGKLVFTDQFRAVAGANVRSLNINHLPVGLYVLQLEATGKPLQLMTFEKQ